ncbi:MAG: hypothetical protein ABSC49_02640 [Candidatus Microgenomates bacterium]|jgi:hypothetical protein
MLERYDDKNEYYAPKWWHDAIRQTIDGNRIDSYTYISDNVRLTKDLSFSFVSVLSTPNYYHYKPGIYIHTNMPYNENADTEYANGKMIQNYYTNILNRFDRTVPVCLSLSDPCPVINTANLLVIINRRVSGESNIKYQIKPVTLSFFCPIPATAFWTLNNL